jgi:DNA-binding transcriptional LysR family regulator
MCASTCSRCATSFARLGFKFARITTVPDLNVIAALRAAGAGVGVLPASVARPLGLTRVPQAPTYKDELCVVLRAEHKRNRALKAIGDAVVTALRA